MVIRVLIRKGYKRIFTGDRNIVCFDLGGGDRGIFI